VVAFSPNGTLALSGSGNRYGESKDNTIRVWNVQTGAEIRRFTGHSDAVVAAQVHPDGRSILSASRDGLVILWDIESGKEIIRFAALGGRLWSLALSGDGRRALTGSDDGDLRLWDVERGQELRRLRGHKTWVASVAISPDGRLAASGSGPPEQAAIIWDIESGKAVRTIEETNTVGAIAFDPSGRRILTGFAIDSATLGR
jgi:WD40 repeat protein